MRSISNGRSLSSGDREQSSIRRRRLPGACTLIGLSLCAWFSGRGFAQPAGGVQGATIVVQAAPDCTEATSLASRIRARLARDAAVTTPAATLHVVITQRTGRVHAEICLRSDAGADRTRSIDAPTCKEAVDAAALIGALLIDPLAESRAPDPTFTVPPRAEALSSEVAARPVQPPRRPASTPLDQAAPSDLARTLRVGLMPAALIIGGVAPRAQPGGGLSADARVSPLPTLELGARAGARIALPHDEVRAEGRVTFGWWSAMAALCTGWHPHGVVTFAGCAVSEYGRIRARGVNVRNPRRSVRPWAALGPGLSLTWQLSRRLSLDTSGEALFPVLRDRFLLADQVVHLVPRLLFRAQLGLLVRIW